MSLSEALIRFRGELSEVPRLSSNDRIRLMEEFKSAFDRSMDYDLASERILGQLMASFSRSKKADFASYWKGMNRLDKGLLDVFQSEEKKARRMIDEEFADGKREVDILNALILAGRNFYMRPLTQAETDKLRYLVISEKVQLSNKGVRITD